MKIFNKTGYTLLSSTENNFSDFLEAFLLQKLDQPKNHIILQLSDNLNITINNLLLFLDISKTYRKHGMSFVIMCNDIDIDEIPDEINVVPTLTEAKDILEMEEIERDLGF